MISTRRTAAVAAVALSSLLAACGPTSSGNGEDGKSADQIVADAKAALKSATSFHLAGFINPDGSSNSSFDMKVDGKDTTSGHMDSGGTAFDFVTSGGKLYFRGKALFEKLSPAVAQVINDQWVTVSGNPDLEKASAAVTAFADSSSLADTLGSAGGPYTKGATKTVNGQSVIAVNSKDGEMDVALNGKPYPVHLDAGTRGKLDITEYGSHFGITAPSGAIDGATLFTSSSSSSSSSTSTDSSSTQAVVDAVSVRDGVLQIAQGTVTSSSGTESDAWGLGKYLVSKLPASIDVSLQSGSSSGLPPATPNKVILYTAATSAGYALIVVVDDTSGKCAAGALTGNPPNGNPQSRTLAAGTACTVENAINAFNS